ncbi:MAG: hypothetical protein M1827_001030 [Pycnora praestabilis]|nr:MAG: hypothetical protein M1827_001030 [Pycnora praestabilis]
MRYSILNLSLLLRAALFANCQSTSFDPREATIETVHNDIYLGLTTCRQVVSSYLSRIQALNSQINTIITLNPNVLSTADAMDAAFAAGNVTGSLFCIPILLKDNYDTSDMNTTGGCLDLSGSQPSVDAPAVTALRQAGALVLGKSNLHELALEGISVSSLGGQTINPYDHTRTPGGSSGGTGAAVAASLAVFGTGTDTVNSLRSPASANGLFSVRPTRGLITRTGIIPISYTQDVIGPIGRSVRDIATALTVMASTGYDPGDNATALVPASSRGVDYSLSLGSGSLQGVRLGLLSGFFNQTSSNETTPVNMVINAMVTKLQSAGAIIVPINETIYNATAISNSFDVQRFEYREDMNSYLQRPSLQGTHPTTLNQLYNSSKFLVIPSQYEYVTTSLVSSTGNATYNTVQRGIQNLTLALQETFTSNNLDAIIYPEQKNLVVKIGSPSQSGRNGILAALTGSPVVTVPAGFSPATTDAPVGVPIGMEILGMPWMEEMLFGVAYEIEQLTHVRRAPVMARGVVEVMNFTSVPIVVPDTANIPKAYPVGVL